METLNYIKEKFNLNLDQRCPIEIPNFGRNQLAKLFCELGYKKGAEIGVESGEYSELLLKVNPNLTLLSIDAWTPHRGYRDHVRREKFNMFYENTKVRLAPFGDRSIMIKDFSMNAVKKIENESLDFVYIDGNHNFLNVTQDIHYWLEKIKVGGIISGHDYVRYGDKTQIHVVQAVQGYTDAYRIKPWFVLGTNAMIPGQIRDVNRSWMWVKI